MSRQPHGMCETTKRTLEALCEARGVTLAAARGQSRSRHLMPARYDCYRYLRNERRWSLPSIGGVFGRDHTTVLYLLRQPAERFQ